MRIKEIKNLDGEVIFTYDEDDKRWIWGQYDMTGVNLERANLQGVIWQEVVLHGANLRGADFYWANLFMSVLSETNCEGARFSGTALEEVNFTRANLKNADFGKDNLGGWTDVSGVNFTDANLDRTKFNETRYDDKTIFPKKFNPEENGLIRIKSK